MLVKFFPHQVAEHWEVLKVGIEESLPPTVGESRDKMNNILESILIGDLTCWVSYDTDNVVNGITDNGQKSADYGDGDFYSVKFTQKGKNDQGYQNVMGKNE